MAEDWGDKLARNVSKRIGRFFADEASLEDIASRDRDEARLFVALAERTLWIWDPASTAGASTYVIVPTDSPAAGRLVRADATLAAAVAGLATDVPGMTCLAGDAVNDVVYFSAANTVAKADADNASKIPAIGVIFSKQSSTSCTVRVQGVVAAAGTFTAGATQYLSTTAGALTETPPASPNATPVGIAVNTTDLLVLPLGPLSYVLRSTSNKLGASTVGIEDSATQITATNVEDALAELAAKFAAGLTPAITKLQIASGTLVAGEATINTNIVVTANTRAFAIPTANVTGSANFGSLAHIAASNVVGGAGVGSVLIRALGNDGAKDADAAGAFAVLLVN